MSEQLEKIANELGKDVSIQSVAVAYVMQKTPYVFPLIGGRKVQYVDDAIRALEIHLSDDHIKAIESVVPFDPGFPISFIGSDPRWAGEVNGFLAAINTHVQYQPISKPIGHQ